MPHRLAPPPTRIGYSCKDAIGSASRYPSETHRKHPRQTLNDRIHSDQANRPVPCKHKGTRE